MMGPSPIFSYFTSQPLNCLTSIRLLVYHKPKLCGNSPAILIAQFYEIWTVEIIRVVVDGIHAKIHIDRMGLNTWIQLFDS